MAFFPAAPVSSAANEPHVLDAAGSPLVQALPQYERLFRGHVELAVAVRSATQQRAQLAHRYAVQMQVMYLMAQALRQVAAAGVL